jgi:hypothetical protein
VSGTVGPAEEPDWRSSVTVREDPDLATELSHRMEAASGLRAIGVTDLLSPRQAFWRLTVPPVPVSPERQKRLESGRRIHRVLATLFAPEGSLEVRVRRQSLVGRIDVLTDRPIELKTTTLAAGPDELLEDRPEHVEQLGMYCALVGRRTGRLVTVVPRGESEAEVRTTDITFGQLDSVSAEMHRRATTLRAALVAGKPRDLPRCRWFDRGCEYLGEPTCDCLGGEPAESSAILDQVVEVTARPEVDRQLAPRLSAALHADRPSSFGRFRELLYPRRTYFDRSRTAESLGPETTARPAPVSDLYGRLLEALEGGPVGEVARLPSRADEPEEEVAGFRGMPYLVRTSRAWSPLEAGDLSHRFPQYPVELGFRCAATGTRSARLIIAYERAAAPHGRLRVFKLDFSPVTTFARLWRTRSAALTRALAERSPLALPACPSWMYSGCPYRPECACGEEPGRSQR